jgi:hypothetical protein
MLSSGSQHVTIIELDYATVPVSEEDSYSGVGTLGQAMLVVGLLGIG